MVTAGSGLIAWSSVSSASPFENEIQIALPKAKVPIKVAIPLKYEDMKALISIS